jgi:copper chaperone CopZ
MLKTYKITGMTCSGCKARIRQLLTSVKGVKNAEVDLEKSEARIEMNEFISIAEFKKILQDHPKYQISEDEPDKQDNNNPEEEGKSWFATYKPILLVFAYILGITLLIGSSDGKFGIMSWMQNFMGGFFIVFSFFKFLNLDGFAGSYAMYDIVAKKWRTWGYIYAFVELLLGLAFITGFNPLLTNLLTFIVMSVSIIGVVQSVINKRKIRCACLGAVFNLPMSTITITEDSLMIIMSAVMLINMF